MTLLVFSGKQETGVVSVLEIAPVRLPRERTRFDSPARQQASLVSGR